MAFKRAACFQPSSSILPVPDAAAGLMGYVSSSFPHLLYFFVKKLKVLQSDLDSAYSKTLCNAGFFSYDIFAKRFYNHLSFFFRAHALLYVGISQNPTPEKSVSLCLCQNMNKKGFARYCRTLYYHL